MKKISIYTCFLTLLMLAFSACEKDRTFPEFKDLEYGAYPRLIEGINGPYGTAFNYFDVDGSFIEFTVEFYDENQGKNVTSYSWTVSYAGGTPVQIASVDASNFGTSPDGLPSASFKFTFAEVLDALGLTIDDVEGGKKFEFLSTLTKSDGKVFTRDNTSTILQAQPAYKALFQIQVPLICPSDLAGTYEANTVGWCGNTWDGIIKFVATAEPGVYDIVAVDAAGMDQVDFSMGAYWACYSPTATLPGGDLKLIDACGKLSYRGASRWGEIYTINNLIVDGNMLTIDWKNDYDPEAGVTKLTRTDGTEWPDLRF